MSESAPPAWFAFIIGHAWSYLHAGAAAVGLAVVALFRRTLAKWARVVWDQLMRRRMIGIENGHKLDMVLAEFRPNGGSSLRDAINRLELGQAELQCHIRINRAHFTQPVFVTNCEGLCTEVNAAYVALVGRPEAELLGYGWVGAIYPNDRPHVREEWFSAVHDKRVFEMAYRMTNADGTIHHVKTHATPITVRGDVVGHVGYLTVVKSVAPPKGQPSPPDPKPHPTDEQRFLAEWSKGVAAYEFKTPPRTEG